MDIFDVEIQSFAQAKLELVDDMDIPDESVPVSVGTGDEVPDQPAG